MNKHWESNVVPNCVGSDSCDSHYIIHMPNK